MVASKYSNVETQHAASLQIYDVCINAYFCRDVACYVSTIGTKKILLLDIENEVEQVAIRKLEVPNWYLKKAYHKL